MRLHPITLRFLDDDDERRYLQSFRERAETYARWTFVVAIVVWMGFAWGGSAHGGRGRGPDRDRRVHGRSDGDRARSAEGRHQRRTWVQSKIIEHERALSEQLLVNVLPPPIALRLKRGDEPIAAAAGQVTVLFADIVGFTVMAAPRRWSSC